MIRIKRAYEPAEKSDGARVLVDRLWPRGLRKDAAALDDWQKELAPSDALRRWFGHDPAKFDEFRARYERELKGEEAQAVLDALARKAARGTVTLLYAAHDEEHNNAVVLADLLKRRLTRPRRAASSPKAPSQAAPRTRAAKKPLPRVPRRGAGARSDAASGRPARRNVVVHSK